MLGEAIDELDTSLSELRELARGIHPAVLTDHGLEPALQALASRAPVPVEVQADPEERLPGNVESAAYFVVSEALANVAKYAQATEAAVAVRRTDGRVTVDVTDDGVGGADVTRGSGLRGLADRVAALDGTLSLESPVGGGTHLHAEIPSSAGVSGTARRLLPHRGKEGGGERRRSQLRARRRSPGGRCRGVPAHFARVSQHLAPSRAVERRSSPALDGVGPTFAARRLPEDCCETRATAAPTRTRLRTTTRTPNRRPPPFPSVMLLSAARLHERNQRSR